jgi:hypothetical protein
LALLICPFTTVSFIDDYFNNHNVYEMFFLPWIIIFLISAFSIFLNRKKFRV